MPDRCFHPGRSSRRPGNPRRSKTSFSIRGQRSFTNRECQSPRPLRGDAFFFVFDPVPSPPRPLPTAERRGLCPTPATVASCRLDSAFRPPRPLRSAPRPLAFCSFLCPSFFPPFTVSSSFLLPPRPPRPSLPPFVARAPFTSLSRLFSTTRLSSAVPDHRVPSQISPADVIVPVRKEQGATAFCPLMGINGPRPSVRSSVRSLTPLPGFPTLNGRPVTGAHRLPNKIRLVFRELTDAARCLPR